MTYLRKVDIAFQDTANLDAFGRLRVAEPQTLFDAQFTYDLQPLVFQAFTTNGSTAAVTHDSTNRRANISFIGLGGSTNDLVYLQSYEYFRYQPGKGHEINITFNMGTAVSGIRKFAQYGDTSNAIGFYQEGDGTLSFRIITGTGAGNQTVNQASWNVDKLDGTGKSGLILDITKDQIIYIDMQALYVGRVRCGFSIDGKIIVCHEFKNANALTTPYIQTANLPIRVGMQATSNGVTGTMYFNCSMVASSGGIDEAVGYEFSTPNVSVTAGNGTRTHAVSLRPRTTFNSIENRVKLALVELDMLVTGTNPVYYEILLGATFTGAVTWANVNTNYSAMEYGTGATITGSSIVVNSGYIPSTASNKGVVSRRVTERFPVTLDSSGAQRTLGTLTLAFTGLGGSSAARGVINFKEIR